MLGCINTPHPDRVYVRRSPATDYFLEYLLPAIHLRPIASREGRSDSEQARWPISSSVWDTGTKVLWFRPIRVMSAMFPAVSLPVSWSSTVVTPQRVATTRVSAVVTTAGSNV